jgi:hypothetical protein
MIEFQGRYPPESVSTDISLSQFLSIQEKGVSAWEFIPIDLEQSSSVFVQSRTEISFYDDDSEACVQTNLPIPKQNEVYYWEAKLHDKPETTLVSVGLATKPYPSFRLPGTFPRLLDSCVGWNKHSLAYTSLGQKRFNQPFNPPPQVLLHPPFPMYQEGDVVGVGYRPRTGTIFFTRNGKKLEETIHPSFKTSNFFPTVGASGPCSIHVNFGQAGFVFIEANVKKWGLAPMTGTLAPPPRYGREDESILLDSGRSHAQNQTPKYSRGHTRGTSWASVGGSVARTQTMQSDISLSSLPNNSPPSYASFSDGEEEVDDDVSESGEETPRPSTTDTAPLIQRRNS